MDYKIVRRTLKMVDGEPEKYFPYPVWNGSCSLNELAEEISLTTTLSPADVKACIECLLQAIPNHLKAGQIVRCGSFGSFKLSFSAAQKGSENEEDVKASNIVRTKVIFRQGSELKRALQTVSFRQVKTSTPTKSDN